MLSKKQSISLFIILGMSILSCLAIVVPFGLEGMAANVFQMKYVILPVVLIALGVIGIIFRYANFDRRNRFVISVSNIPVISGTIALLFSGLFLVIRNASQLALSDQLVQITIYVVTIGLMILFLILSTNFYAGLSPKATVFADILLIAVYVVVFLDIKSFAEGYVDQAMAPITLPLLISIVSIGAVIAALHVVSCVKAYVRNDKYRVLSGRKLVNDWFNFKEDVSKETKDELLYSLKKFLLDEYGINAVVEVEVPVEVEKPVVKVIEMPIFVDRVETVVKEVAVDKIVELPIIDYAMIERNKEFEEENQKLREEHLAVVEERIRLSELEKELLAREKELNDVVKEARVATEKALLAAEIAKASAMKEQVIIREVVKEEPTPEEEVKELVVEEKVEELETEVVVAAEPKPVVEKVKKVLIPSYEDVLRYAKAIPNVEVKEIKPTSHKLYLNKKMFLALQSTNNDYRITFLCELDEAIKLIVENPKDFVKATSPKGDNWFKFIYRGAHEQYSESYIYDIVDRSLEMLNVLETRKEEAKREARRIKAEAKAREKENQKELAKRVEENKKAKEEIVVEDALEEAIERVVKQATQEVIEQQEEKARIAAEKAAEKERIAAEKAAQKEAEKARIAAEKAKEKERLAKEKEKARVAAQKAKEKEKAKAAAQKAKEKEKAKAAAQKAKEKEKAKVAAQKAKEKEKAAQQKAKEKEAKKAA